MAGRWRMRWWGAVISERGWHIPLWRQGDLLKMALRAAATVVGVAAAPGQAAPCTETSVDGSIPAVVLETVASGFEQPVHIHHAGDGSGRLFVVEQPGRIMVLDRGRRNRRVFLDIRDRVRAGGEKGLLSVAFHPDFRRNGRFYVNYTGGRRVLKTVVAEFRVDARGQGDPRSERRLLEITQPYGNHNGGQVAFGPDRYLYVGMGDGGAANDPLQHGQNVATLLGALLRIDVNRADGYGIPADNPFAGRGEGRAEIFAYGFRNPWRFSFDPVTGALWLADVGQSAREEIDRVEKGGNYGWNIMEGDICTPGVRRRCHPAGLKAPVHVYGHDEGASITGGVVYRGHAVDGLCGTYLYADYVTKKVWGLRVKDGRVAVNRLLVMAPDHVSSFGEDEEHEVYLAGHQRGMVMRITTP